MALLDLLAAAAAVVVLVPVALFCLQVWAALLPGGRLPPRTDHNPRAVLLIPAHDEELLLADTLRHLWLHVPDHWQRVVIADNCTDRTAALARQAGAVVLERTDRQRRGKSHALQYAVEHLPAPFPEVVVIVDADCRVQPGALERIAGLAHRRQRPVQAAYTFSAGGLRGALPRVAALAIGFKNLIRPLGLSRLGMPCQLTGSGMAIPWSAVQRVPAGNTALTEDTQWGLDLVLAGYPPMFCPQAQVASRVPATRGGFFQQRRRWEHGYLLTMLSQIPRLVAGAVRQRRLAPLWAAVDLLVPPLGLLAWAWGAALAWSLLVVQMGGVRWPATALLEGGGAMVVTVVTGWAVFLRREVPLTTVALIPWYVLRKAPLYASFLFRRQRQWLRTPRDADSMAAGSLSVPAARSTD